MAIPQSYATHGEVFPGLPDSFAEFKQIVRRLSRTDALLWCGRINVHLGYPLRHDPVQVQRALVDAFFEGEDLERLRSLAKAREGGVQVFFRGQMLELLRWVSLLAHDAENDGTSFEDAGLRRDFVRAALMASDIWGRRIYPDGLSLDGGLVEARRRALESLRRSHTENSCGPPPWLSLARGALVLERMTAADRQLPAIFEQQVGLTPREYFSALAYFLLIGSGKALEDLKNPDGSGLLDLRTLTPTDGALGRICSAYLTTESQTPDALRRALWGGDEDAEEARASSFDLNLLRAKPILRVHGGRGVILDQVLMAERATAGPLFHLVAADRRRANHWFARFGDAFEAYVRDSMQEAFPPASGPLQRFFPNAKGEANDKDEVELADAVVFDAKDAVFVELKAVWMNERTPETAQSPELFLNEVRKRYSTSEQASTTDKRVSGVGQLGRSLRRIASGAWQAKDFDSAGLRDVYPVLLVHDLYLDAAVYSQFLAQELATDLLGASYEWDSAPMKVGSLLVHHLAVLTIDEWELIEGFLERFSFGECLREYDRSCPDRMVSFRDFLLMSRYRENLRYSARLREVRDRLLDEAVSALLPEARDDDPASLGAESKP